jgi:hypothetical protein
MVISIFSHPVNHGYELDEFPQLIAVNDTKVLFVFLGFSNQDDCDTL